MSTRTRTSDRGSRTKPKYYGSPIPPSAPEPVDKMMYVFGDAVKSNEEVVRVVEDFARRKTITIMSKVAKNVVKQGRERVTLMDVLSVYTRDMFRTDLIQKRLGYKLPYIRGMKEFRKRKVMLDDKQWKKVYRENSAILSLGEIKPDYMLKDCSLNLEIEEYEKSKEKHRELLASNMNTHEYSVYLKSSDITFLYIVQNGYMCSTLKKFSEWISYSPTGLGATFDRGALEALGAIAYDTVGLVTQVALLVKKDMHLQVQDQFEVSQGIVSGCLPMKDRSDYSTFALPEDPDEAIIVNNTVPLRMKLGIKNVLEAIRRIREKEIKRKFKLSV